MFMFRWLLIRASGFALLFVSGRAGAVAAPEPAARLSRAQIQALHESCQRQIDEGRAVEAAQCLERVYQGLIAMESSATVDLYYVLADAVAALQAAAAVDPRDLCRADVLLKDYRGRSRRLAVRRYDARVSAMHKAVGEGLEQARATAGRDICGEPPAEAAGAAAGDAAAEPAGAVEAGEATGTGEARVDGPVKSTDVSTKPRTMAPAMKRTTPRRELFQPRLPYTALLDASFGVTLAGVAGAGVGAALYIYGLECKEGPPRCSEAAPTGVRDAGLVLMSAGAATMIVGFGLRFADHRAARKALRALPRPAAAPTAVALTWQGRF